MSIFIDKGGATPYDESKARLPRTWEEQRLDWVTIQLLREGLERRKREPIRRPKDRETEGRLPIFRPV